MTGGAGVVGKALCRELLTHKVCVRVLTLSGDAQVGELPPQVQVFYGDVTEKSSIERAFEGVDIVYHLAAILLCTKKGGFEKVNALGTKNVTEAASAAGVKRLVYVSSISVTYPILTEYGKSKLQGENFVRTIADEHGMEWTIVRPTLVVGNGGGIEYNMFARYVERFYFYFLPGGGKCLKRPVKSEDLVRGIANAGLSSVAAKKTYALAGSKVISMAGMAKFILQKKGKHHKMVAFPWWLCRGLAVLKSLIGGRRVTAEQALAGFLYDAAPSIEDAICDLDYNPESPFE